MKSPAFQFYPADYLADAKRRHSALVRADGPLAIGGIVGSIHKTGSTRGTLYHPGLAPVEELKSATTPPAGTLTMAAGLIIKPLQAEKVKAMTVSDAREIVAGFVTVQDEIVCSVNWEKAGGRLATA